MTSDNKRNASLSIKLEKNEKEEEKEEEDEEDEEETDLIWYNQKYRRTYI